MYEDNFFDSGRYKTKKGDHTIIGEGVGGEAGVGAEQGVAAAAGKGGVAVPGGSIKVIRITGNGGGMIKSIVPASYIGAEPARLGGGGPLLFPTYDISYIRSLP